MRRRLLLAIAVSLALQGGSELRAQEDEEEVDWPATITRLRRNYQQHPGRARTREQLAIAYNNYGVELMEASQWREASYQFSEALRLDPDSADVKTNFSHMHFNQAHEAFEARKARAALASLEKALKLSPELVSAYVLKGRIEYDRQRLKAAKKAWDRALELDPSREDVTELMSRLTDELPVETEFERLSQAFFDLRYEEHLERPVGWDIRDALLQGRRTIGSDFAYWHKYKIVVLVYSPENFRKIRQETPEWMGGQFDGKIRLPLPSEQYDQATVRNILFHEYTHAVIRDVAEGKCPKWLNEGLAEYQGRTQASTPLYLLQQAHEQDRLIPWPELSDHIAANKSHEEVGLAYEQSYSIVAYLIQRYRFWKVRHLLKAVAGGQAWEEAMENTYRTKLPRLEQRWLEQLSGFIAEHRS